MERDSLIFFSQMGTLPTKQFWVNSGRGKATRIEPRSDEKKLNWSLFLRLYNTYRVQHGCLDKSETSLHKGIYWHITIARNSHPSGEIRHPFWNFFFCLGLGNIRDLDNVIWPIYDQECWHWQGHIYLFSSVVSCYLFVEVIVTS